MYIWLFNKYICSGVVRCIFFCTTGISLAATLGYVGMPQTQKTQHKYALISVWEKKRILHSFWSSSIIIYYIYHMFSTPLLYIFRDEFEEVDQFSISNKVCCKSSFSLFFNTAAPVHEAFTGKIYLLFY